MRNFDKFAFLFLDRFVTPIKQKETHSYESYN